MSWWQKLALRVRALFRKGRVEQELEEELQFHLERQIEENVAAGMNREEARYAARRAFGGVDQIKEACRDMRGVTFVEILIQDLRYATRVLRKSPTFTATVVVTLSLGLGLNTAFFTIFNAYVLRPLEVRDPHSLYQLSYAMKERSESRYSEREFNDLRAQTAVLSEALAERQCVANLKGEMSCGLIVSGNYFSMLGGYAAMGRPIQNDDAEAVIVLSHQAWKNRFGADERILGQTVLLGKQPFVVIGVAQPTFAGLNPTPPDFWIPVAGWGLVEESRQVSGLEVVGRLRKGVTKEQAQAALSAYVRHATADRREELRAIGVDLRPRANLIDFPPQAILTLLPLWVAFGLTMAIPCANVANMMLARGLARQREIGIRLALGASRRRVVRQLLTEGFVLALLAGLAGIVIADGALRLALRVVLTTIPPAGQFMVRSVITDLTVDHRVFMFVLLGAVAMTVAFALAPALQATRPGVSFALRGEYGTVRVSRLRDALVVGQVMACSLLLVCTGVLLRGTERMTSIDPGYETRGVYSFWSNTSQVVPEVAPLLRDQAWVDMMAYASSVNEIPVGAEGQDSLQPAAYSFISSEYLPLFRIPVIRGRNFTKEEAASGAAVVLVSQAAASRLWPGEEAIGKRLRINASASQNRRNVRRLRLTQAEVIGVTKDVMDLGGSIWASADGPRLYFPAQLGEAETLFVRGKGDPERTGALLEKALMQIAASDRVINVFSLEERRYWDLYPLRAASWVASVLGGLALLLTASGIYGVLSYVVNQRTKEIGIRMALGATPVSVVQFIMGYSMKLAGIGLVLGGMLTMGASKLFVSLFVGKIDVFDAVAYTVGLAVVALTAAVAAFGPARRATQVDPMVALRYE